MSVVPKLVAASTDATMGGRSLRMRNDWQLA
jgi:hypothetical protein